MTSVILLLLVCTLLLFWLQLTMKFQVKSFHLTGVLFISTSTPVFRIVPALVIYLAYPPVYDTGTGMIWSSFLLLYQVTSRLIRSFRKCSSVPTSNDFCFSALRFGSPMVVFLAKAGTFTTVVT